MSSNPKSKPKAMPKRASSKAAESPLIEKSIEEVSQDSEDAELGDDEKEENAKPQSKKMASKAKPKPKGRPKGTKKTIAKRKAKSKRKSKSEDKKTEEGLTNTPKNVEITPEQASREIMKAKNIMLNEMKTKMREEKILALKKKHDEEMKTIMHKEAEAAKDDSEACPEVNAKASGEMDMILVEHPYDIMVMDQLSDSEVSEIDEADIKGSSSGAYIELDDLDENIYISTWTFVLTAARYQSNPSWRHIDRDDNVHFYKDKCHTAFRTTLKKLTRKMNLTYKWEYEDILTAVFEENPDLIKCEDLREHCRKDKWGQLGGRTHAHILCQYEGNRKRGCLVRVVKKMRDFYSERGWKMHASTIFNPNKSRPLHDSREKQHSYLMCAMNQKEVVDLEPSTSRAWVPMPVPDARQWRELRIAMGKPAERDTVLNHMRTLKPPPGNADEYLTLLRNEIKSHSELYQQDRSQWRKEYYKYLPLRQIKKYIEGCLRQRGSYKQLLDSLSVETVNQTLHWGYKEFWQRSISMQCTCGANLQDDCAPTSKRMRYAVPKVSEKDSADLLQGRTPETVRAFVLNSTNYRNFKLMLKHKCHVEPEQNIIYEMGKHLFLLTSSTVVQVGRRLQNMHWASLVGDSGKSAMMSMLMSVYGCLGEDCKEHIVLTVTPEAFGSHGASAYSLYKAVRINEVTPGTLTGGLMRLLLEGDVNARMPTKGDSVKVSSAKTAQHAIVWMTSNLPAKEEFLKVAKDMGLQCRWTGSDYDRIFSSNGGRVGAEFRTEAQIPPILRREIFECCFCGALLVKWLVRKYVLATFNRIQISREQIWEDSDEEMDHSHITIDTDFWKVINLDPDQLEEKQTKLFQEKARQGKQTYRMDAQEAELFAKFKEKLREDEMAQLKKQWENEKAGMVSTDPSSKSELRSPSSKKESSPASKKMVDV